MIVLIGLCLWGRVLHEPFRIELYVYLQTVSYGIVAMAAFFLVLSRTEFFRLHFDKRFFMKIIRESFPFAILTLLTVLYYRVDSVMLERMLPDGAEQAGIYAQAFRILDAFAMYGYLFAVILLPLFSRMIKENKSVTDLLRFAFLLLMIPVLVISLASIIFRYPLMDMLYINHMDISSDVLGLLMGALVFVSSGYLYGTLLTAGGDIKKLSWLAGLGFLLNIILNTVLIPHYQAIGSAWASLVTQACIGIGQIILVHRKFSLSIRQLIPFRTYSFTGIVIILGIALYHSGINSVIGYSILIGISLILATAIKLIPVRNMIGILLSEEKE